MKFTPILYEADEKSFTDNGLGKLEDFVSLTCTEELNGIYEIEAEYSTDGAGCAEITVGRIILCLPHKGDTEPEAFYIYATESDMSSGLKKIYGRQVALNRMAYTIVSIITESTADGNTMVQKLMKHLCWPNPRVDCDYTVSSDITTTATWKSSLPRSMYDCFFDSDDGLLVTFGGEMKYHYYDIQMVQARGEETGQNIEYAQNLRSLSETVDESEVITGVVAYWAKEDESGNVTVKYGEEPIVWLDETESAFGHAAAVDCTSSILAPNGASTSWTPSAADITDWAKKYLAANYDGSIPVTLSATIVDDPEVQTDHQIALGDIIQVKNSKMAVDSKAKVITTVYNCITDQNDSVEVGSSRTNLAGTLLSLTAQKKSIQQITTGGGNSGSEDGWSWTIADDESYVDLTTTQEYSGSQGTYTYLGYRSSSKYTINLPGGFATGWDYSSATGSWDDDADGVSGSPYSLTGTAASVSFYILRSASGSWSGTMTINVRLTASSS